MAAEHIPVFLVTGFLGAGKTRVMSRIAQLLSGSGAHFLFSEFGPGGIDGAAVDAPGVDLSSIGCICCAGYETAVIALERLARPQNSRRPSEIFIETSGASDVAALLVEFQSDLRFRRLFDLRCVLTLVDCAGPFEQLANFAEWRSQLRYADIVAFTHVDELHPLDAPARLAAARDLVAQHVPDGVGRLANPDTAALLTRMRVVRRDAGRIIGDNSCVARHAGLQYTSVPVVSRHDLDAVVGLAQALICFNPSLLRMKAIVGSIEGGRLCYLVHIVAGRLLMPECIELTGRQVRQGRIYVLDPLIGSAQIEPLVELFLPIATTCESPGVAGFVVGTGRQGTGQV